jgi:hypothetical protein
MYKPKFLALLMLIITFVSCQKDVSFSSTQQQVLVNKGVVTFPTFSSYLSVVENKNGEQAKLFSEISRANYQPLKEKEIIANTNTNSIVATITNSFNPDLYSDYLLGLLNQDKIFSLNGFYIKVDMDNEFCSVVDSSIPGAYNLLTGNSFSSNGVMLFTHYNEPVLEVLEKIKNNELTWSQYQTELSNAKGGQGICFKNGAKQEFKNKTYYNFIGGTLPGGYLRAKGEYRAEFLHFRFKFESWVGNVGNIEIPVCHSSLRLNYIFDWAGACKNGASGDVWIDNRNVECNKLGVTLYSGGSALKKANLTLKCFARKGVYSTDLNDYLWNNVYNGNVPLKLGY